MDCWPEFYLFYFFFAFLPSKESHLISCGFLKSHDHDYLLLFLFVVFQAMSEQGKVIPVRVALRCRPLGAKEISEGCTKCVNAEGNSLNIGRFCFTYDYVFDEESTQDQIYEKSVEKLIHGLFQGNNSFVFVIFCIQPIQICSISQILMLMEQHQQLAFRRCYCTITANALILFNISVVGFNATVLAYGQTGSGKTYTMGGGYGVTTEEEKMGIIPRVVKEIFKTSDELTDHEVSVSVSYLEVQLLLPFSSTLFKSFN